MFTSPKKFALDNEARHAKDAGSLSGFTDCIVFNPTFASQITPETCRVGIDFR